MKLRLFPIAALLAATISAQPITDDPDTPTECGSDPVQQADYRGTISVTINGLECQRWDSQSPNGHSRKPENYPNAGLEDNYCRNPDGEPKAWCYTTGGVRWEFCNVPTCDPPPTYTDCGSQWVEGSWVGQSDYRGTIARTISGRTCQRWDSQSPHTHSRTFETYPYSGLDENYCRNPDDEPQAWCYTTDPDKRWEYCDVPVCDDGPPSAPSFCYDYTDVLNLGPKACTDTSLYRKIKKMYNEQAKKPGATDCKGGVQRELMALTRTTSIAAAHRASQDLCDNALEEAGTEAGNNGWEVLEEEGLIDLEEFFEGGGFLNEETGNFQQEANDFIKRGGYEKFIYIGDDPRKNDYLSTTEQSYNGGKAIKSFYSEEVSLSILLSPSTSSFKEGSCPLTNSAVCCWHRDRQYFDNNGNCNERDCANQNPMDNTDLCWTKEGSNVFPYPGDDTENDLHCHGFAWAREEGDYSAKAKWNNLFYVSLYDHLYQRGYADAITDDSLINGQQAMCGCVEDMNPVARADCTEVIARTNYTAYQDGEGGPYVIRSVPETFSLEFQACKGYNYVEDFGPEDYAANPNAAELVNSQNDLAAYVYRLYLEGKLDGEHADALEQTIIGYRNPDVNDGDAQREAACKAAFEEKFPGKPYTE